MNNDELKLKLIMSLLGSSTVKETNKESSEFWVVGKTYLIRTVTMIYLGNLKAVLNDNELLLKECAWIPETSRWSDFLNGQRPNEQEPYPGDVLVGRGAIVDATEYKKQRSMEVI